MSSPRASSGQFRARRILVIAGLIVGALIVLAAILFAAFSPRLTTYVGGPAFAQELNKQTAKGLHLKTAQYENIQRTGTFTATSEHFTGSGGIKAIKSITANDVVAVFNPGGVLLRRWQLSSIHMKSGTVEVQTYTPKPENKPPKPWYAFLMPGRVYLREIACDQTDITWPSKDKKSGIFGAKLLIIPHGRDFDYRADGGTFRAAPVPEMPLSQIHMLITKELLSLWALDLKPSEKGSIHLEGKVGLKDDKSMHLLGIFKAVPVSPWIPTSWGDQVHGVGSGQVVWEGKDQKIESSHGHGDFHFTGIRLQSIPFCDYAASATQNRSLKNIDLTACSLTFTWEYPRVEVNDIELEAENQFHLQGSLTLTGKALSGTFQLGVSEQNLDFLPKAKETIFTKSHDGLLWTTVKITGTLDAPQNDLTPRIEEALKVSPASATGLFFRTLGEWFKQKTSGD